MKRLFALLVLSIAGFAVQAPPHAIPGKIYETSTEVITPSAGPRVDHGIDVFMTADFLYWTARMDGLGYVHTGASAGTTNAPKGKTRYPDWRWKPGFKVGLGLNIPHDGWDVYAEYTWLHSSAWDSLDNNQLGVFPIWNISNLVYFADSVYNIEYAKANWNLSFNTIDLSLGRNYFISRYLTLRPFVGFKGAWNNQDYHVNYLFVTDETTSRGKMKNDQSYWGIGLRSGLNTAWHFTQAWSIYGDLSLSILWSQFDVRRTDIRNDSRNGGGENSPPVGIDIATFNTKNSFHTLKGVLELGIGMRGEWWFCEDRYHFLIQGGWEEHLWINHNQLVKALASQSQPGDLILQGLTIKARFDF